MNSTVKTVVEEQPMNSFPKQQSHHVALPKINKRMPVKHQQSFHSRPSFLEKVTWLANRVDYTSQSEKQINEEHKALRDLLKELNIEVAKIMQNARFQVAKTPRTNVELSEVLSVRDKEIQNNCLIIENYKEEFNKVKERVMYVSEATSAQQQIKLISDFRDKIQNLKNSIKELKKQNLLRGNVMVQDNTKIKEIRELEANKLILDGKRNKLAEECKLNQTELAEIKKKNMEATGPAQAAQKFLEDHQKKQNMQNDLKLFQQILETKQIQVESTRKKLESLNATNQQKYFSRLKELENAITNGQSLDEKLKLIQVKLIQSRKTIGLMEQQQAKRVDLIQQPSKLTQPINQRVIKRTNSVEIGTD